jgi:hypothetical protein
VPHNLVETKIRSKKKLVMQLDRDVRVCGVLFLGSLDTPCLGFSSSFLRGVMLHIYFFYAL